MQTIKTVRLQTANKGASDFFGGGNNKSVSDISKDKNQTSFISPNGVSLKVFLLDYKQTEITLISRNI